MQKLAYHDHRGEKEEEYDCSEQSSIVPIALDAPIVEIHKSVHPGVRWQNIHMYSIFWKHWLAELACNFRKNRLRDWQTWASRRQSKSARAPSRRRTAPAGACWRFAETWLEPPCLHCLILNLYTDTYLLITRVYTASHAVSGRARQKNVPVSLKPFRNAFFWFREVESVACIRYLMSDSICKNQSTCKDCFWTDLKMRLLRQITTFVPTIFVLAQYSLVHAGHGHLRKAYQRINLTVVLWDTRRDRFLLRVDTVQHEN